MVTESVPEPERHSSSPQYGQRFYQQLISSYANDVKHTLSVPLCAHTHFFLGCCIFILTPNRRKFSQSLTLRLRLMKTNPCLFSPGYPAAPGPRDLFSLASLWPGWFTDAIASVCPELTELMAHSVTFPTKPDLAKAVNRLPCEAGIL